MKRFRIVFKDGSEMTIEASYTSTNYDSNLRASIVTFGDTWFLADLIKGIVLL